MVKFIHAADIHLDSPLIRLSYHEGAPVDELRQATRQALNNLVALAITEKVDFVLISGDLYDGDWKDYNTGLYFVSQMSKLREAHIPVYLISGNHDAASKITRTIRFPEGTHVFPKNEPSTLIVKNLDVAIHGQSFASPAVTQNLSLNYPAPIPGNFNIGMLHTCATGREGHEPYAPCTVEDLQLKGYDYWALGHVHQREILSHDPLIVFPGNTQGRNIRETGAKGCMLVTVDEKGRPSADFKSLDVIRWIRLPVDASGAGSGNDVVDLVSENMERILGENSGMPLIARVEIAGSSPAHTDLAAYRERWINDIKSVAVDISGDRIWIEKVKFRTTSPKDIETGAHAEGPIGELWRYLDTLRSDSDQLIEIGETLKEITRKLPREVMEDREVISPEDPQWLAEQLDQVGPMLVRRLMRKEDLS
jgi:DNA repair exonuclease SbcCD nuclease subunit